MSFYDFTRHTGPRDFAKDCKPFTTYPCPRCGDIPERPEWITCAACQLLGPDKAKLVPSASKSSAKRGGHAGARAARARQKRGPAPAWGKS